MKTKLTAFIFFSVALMISCDKQRARKLSGTYHCRVEQESFDMVSLESDTIFFQDLIVEQQGKEVKVLGTTIHIDSLWKEKEYYESGFNSSIRVLFREDSVFIEKYNGGQGGYTYWYYKGLKK